MGINAFFSDFVPRLMNIFGFFIVGIIAVMPLLLGKKYIVSPRIGVIKFGPKRKALKKKFILFSVINTLILIIILILTINSVLQQIPLRGATLLLVAYVMQFPRLFVYGLLIGFGLPLAEILEFSLTIFLIGVIILSIGIIYFIKFLRKYPIPEEVS